MRWVLLLLISSATLLAMEEWDDFVKERYVKKSKEQYRIYDDQAPQRVKDLYYQNHKNQTVALATEKRQEYGVLNHSKMGVWEAMKLLDSLVDESDPDIELTQSYHAYQTAEALRKDGQPRWLILVGFIHDLGKMLTSYGEAQWAVVGDTFPVGCKYSDAIVFPEYFSENPDFENPLYQTQYGIYSPHCGLDNVVMSWGHDEYLYQVVKDYLPEEAAYIIRYHSFYPAHRENAYQYLMDAYDEKMLPWLKLFSQYDLYSKEGVKLDIDELRPFYEELIREFLPESLSW